MLPRYTGKGYMKSSVKALIDGYVIPIMGLTRLGAVRVVTPHALAADDVTGSPTRSLRLVSYPQIYGIRGSVPFHPGDIERVGFGTIRSDQAL
jgi:hypothetical protein